MEGRNQEVRQCKQKENEWKPLPCRGLAMTADDAGNKGRRNENKRRPK